MSRVDMEIIRPWINKTITDYLGVEDDVLFEFICNQLDEPVTFVFLLSPIKCAVMSVSM